MENRTELPTGPKGRLAQILRIHPQETGLLVVLGLLLFCNSVATQVSSVVAVSGFLSEGGVKQIPIVWVVDMVVIMLTTGLHSLVVDRFERTKLLGAMTFGFALLFVALRLLFVVGAPGWLNYGLMFILSEQQWLFFPLVFWVLANDVYLPSQAKRLFPLIAGVSFLGELIGLAVAAAAPKFLQGEGRPSSEELLLFNVLIYLLAYIVVAFGLSKVEVRQTAQQRGSLREVLSSGWSFVREVPAFRWLTVAILGVNVCLTFLEFHFLVVTDQIFTTNYQTFYGLYRLGLILIAFILQSFLTSRLIEKVTLKNSFLFMPFALLIGSVTMLLTSVASAIAGMAVPKVTQYTVDESTRKSFQTLVPEERRGRVSMFMESLLFAFATFVGALIILAIVFLGAPLGEMVYSYIYRSLAVVAALIAIVAVLKMRGVYDLSMFDWRLKRRQRRGLTGVMDKLNFDE